MDRGSGPVRGSACVECSGPGLASRHSAVSRKAAQNQTMPLYGNNWMQRTSFCLVRNAGQKRHLVAAYVIVTMT